MLNKSELVWLQVKRGWGSESWKEGVAGSGTGLLDALMPEESFACKSLTQEDRVSSADCLSHSGTQPESRCLGNPAGTHCLRVEEAFVDEEGLGSMKEGRMVCNRKEAVMQCLGQEEVRETMDSEMHAAWLPERGHRSCSWERD